MVAAVSCIGLCQAIRCGGLRIRMEPHAPWVMRRQHCWYEVMQRKDQKFPDGTPETICSSDA